MNARFLLLGLLVLVILTIPSSSTRVHAVSEGLVCLSDLNSVALLPSNPCPSPARIFNGPVGQQIRIGVFINGSAGFNGFDIALKADNTVLRPAGIDLAGSLLSGESVTLLECLGTFNVTGFRCDPAVDTVDTLRIAVIRLGVGLTPTPSTGLLFTAIYNVTATTSSSLTIGFQSGCVSSSVGGTICVAFSNGTGIPVPETIQGAIFNNASPPPYLAISSSSSLVGPMIASSLGTLRLNLTGQNGWNGFDGPVTISTIANSSLWVVLNTTSPAVPSSGSAFVSMNITGTLAGNFSVAVVIQYSTFDSLNSATDTLVNSLIIRVVVFDFAISANPANVPPMQLGIAGSSQITVSGENGFSGTVELSNTFTGQCNLSASSLVVPGSASSKLSCSFSSAGSYSVTVTGRSGPDLHSIHVNFVVQDFSISSSPTVVITNPRVASSSTVSVAFLDGFSGTVTLVVTTNSTSLSCSLDASTISSASGPATLSCTGSVFGNYNATIVGSSGTLSHSTTVLYRVQDLVISTSVTSVTVNTGTAGVSTMTVSPLNGFAETVNLAIATNSTSLACSLSSTSISGGSGTSSASCTGSIAGNYLATVTAAGASLSLSTTVTYHVQDFALSATSSQASLAAGSNVSIALVLTGLNGFNHLVRVTVVSPAGLTVTPIQTSLLAPGTVRLVLAGDSLGNYSVNITVSSDNLSHSMVLNVKVTSAPRGSSTLFGLAPALFYSILAVLVVLCAVAVLIGVRWRRAGRVVRPPVVGKRSGRRNL